MRQLKIPDMEGWIVILMKSNFKMGWVQRQTHDVIRFQQDANPLSGDTLAFEKWNVLILRNLVIYSSNPLTNN
jgi:hypothetical protein